MKPRKAKPTKQVTAKLIKEGNKIKTERVELGHSQGKERFEQVIRSSLTKNKTDTK